MSKFVPSKCFNVPDYLRHDLSQFALHQVNRLGGPKKALALSVFTLAGIALVRLYFKYIRVPPHLQGLPRVPFSFTLRNLFAKEQAIKRMNAEYDLVVKDALRRGHIKSIDEHPPMWALWSNGKWDLVLANPTDLKELFSKHEIFEKFDAEALHLYGMEKFVGGSNLAIVRTPEWKHQRKIINPAFRRGWATSLFADPASQLIAQFDKFAASGDPVNASKWTSCMALDALSSVIFGKSFDCINNPESDIFRVYSSLMINYGNPLTNLLGYSIYRYSSQIKQFDRDVEQFDEFVFKWIDEKTRIIKARGSSSNDDNSDSRDLLEMMVSAQLQDSDSFTREDLRANCATFFLAGHDTTATTLAFALYSMGMNKLIQEKVRQEVIKIMGDADPNAPHDKIVFATNEQQNAMRYLTCVIKETLRLFPPLPIVPAREVMTEHVLPSSQLCLPKGSFVTGSLWRLHRTKEFWGNDANEFKPERWESLTHDWEPIPLHPGAHNFSWSPFGGGQRSCIGQQFSIVEQRVVLSALVLRYTWEIVGDDAALKGSPTVSPGILLHSNHILVKFSRRK